MPKSASRFEQVICVHLYVLHRIYWIITTVSKITRPEELTFVNIQKLIKLTQHDKHHLNCDLETYLLNKFLNNIQSKNLNSN